MQVIMKKDSRSETHNRQRVRLQMFFNISVEFFSNKCVSTISIFRCEFIMVRWFQAQYFNLFISFNFSPILVFSEGFHFMNTFSLLVFRFISAAKPFTKVSGLICNNIRQELA